MQLKPIDDNAVLIRFQNRGNPLSAQSVAIDIRIDVNIHFIDASRSRRITDQMLVERIAVIAWPPHLILGFLTVPVTALMPHAKTQIVGPCRVRTGKV